MKQEVLEQRLKDLIKGKEDERNWMGSHDGSRETTILILKSILEDLQSLEKTNYELGRYSKLKSEIHKDIEKVWMYDTSQPLSESSEIERLKLIERVFYKIANEWID
jgi:hypothetical protein